MPMSRTKLLSRALPVLMLALWMGFAATIEAQRYKPPQSRGHEPLPRMRVDAGAAGAVLGLMAALSYQPGHMTRRR
jgi:hypothetical protein